VSEKTCLHRNLGGFHPSTVGQAEPNTKDFFKLLMSFPLPRPRYIASYLKAVPRSALQPATKK
ncbi:hypothetical protein CI102_10273, partial [Trichoderma harzianum]